MKNRRLGILVCMLLITATVLPVVGTANESLYGENKTADGQVRNDFMIPSGKESIPDYNFDRTSLVPSYGRLSRGAPYYEFIKEPTTIITSYYDYMPGSYASHPIRLQTENGDGKYLTFHVRETASSTRRQYWTYVDSDENIQDQGLITSYDEWQGYGSIGIHPATGDCIAGWHEDVDADPSVDHTTVTFDDFDASEAPGLWEDPLIVPPTGEMEYAWPYTYVGPSPLGTGYVRVYHLTNNALSTPAGFACEDVRLKWIDVENVNGADLSVLLASENWDEVTVFTDWRDKSCRPFQAFAIDYSNPGKVGFIGNAAWLEGDLGGMPVDEGAFVWESLDYGETWDYANLHSDGSGNPIYYVDNPGHFPEAPAQLEVTIGGWHNTALYDSDGNIHMTFLQQYGYSDSGGSYYFPYFMPQAEMLWDGVEFTFHEVSSMPGTDSLSGHSVPWDETNTYPVIAWSLYPSQGTSAVFHENMQKQAVNLENGWMAQVWVDGTSAQLAADGEPGYEDYVNHPIIFISISSDNGNTWSDPIELTDIYSSEFDFSEQITVYPYICDQITDLGNGFGQIYLYYMDDNNFGSSVHGTGVATGGQITYCSVKIDFSGAGGPDVQIVEISGGLGVSAVIKNDGELDASEVDWSITVTGGIFGLINKTVTGNISSLPAGEEVIVKSGLLLGIGSINITVQAESEIKTATGKQIIIFTTVD